MSHLKHISSKNAISKVSALPEIPATGKSTKEASPKSETGKHKKGAKHAKQFVPTHQIRSLHPEKIGMDDEDQTQSSGVVSQPGANKGTTNILLQVSENNSGTVCLAQDGRPCDQPRPQEGAVLNRRPWAFDASQRGRFDVSRFMTSRRRGSSLPNPATRPQAVEPESGYQKSTKQHEQKKSEKSSPKQHYFHLSAQQQKLKQQSQRSPKKSENADEVAQALNSVSPAAEEQPPLQSK